MGMSELFEFGPDLRITRTTIMRQEQLGEGVKLRFIRTVEYRAEISHKLVDNDGLWNRASERSEGELLERYFPLFSAEEFARAARFLYLSSERAGNKLLTAVVAFVKTGECASNADEDSVCGGTCPVCRKEE